MKKLSTIIALALIITVGGVYAAWNYAQGASASVEITREINMAQVNTDSNKGSISATPTNFAFLVDNAGEYHTVLTAAEGGKLDINFTPNTGADATTANGILMLATVTVKPAPGATQYDGVTPITHNVGNNTIDLTKGTPSRTATLTAADVLGCLSLADVVLDTKAKNDAFHAVLSNYTILITISEIAK